MSLEKYKTLLTKVNKKINKIEAKLILNNLGLNVTVNRTNKPKSRAADNAALRARRKKAGLVSFREYVTPEEKVRLVVCLDNLRGITSPQPRKYDG
jgi:hypothetical protein